MFARMVTFLAVITLVGAPAPARSADTKDTAPTIVIRVDSIDNLIENAKYLAELAGQKDKAGEALGFVKAAIESQKIDKSIDFTRPLGLYGKIDADDFTKSSGVILIPVLEEEPLMDLVENSGNQFGITLEKGKDGIHSLRAEFLPVSIYFRIANKYVYVTAQNKETLAKDSILDPAKVLSSGKASTFSASFRLDQIPDALKQMAVSQMEANFAKEKEKEVSGESKVQTEIRRQMLDGVAKHMTQVINEGAELSLSFNIDRKEGKLTGGMTFKGKPGSELAKEIADVGKSQSLFGGLVASKEAVNFLFHPILPEEVRKAIGPAVDDGVKELLEKEKDAGKKAIAEKLFKAIAPSLKAGELDMAFSFRGPSKENNYTFVGAAKVKDGANVEQALKDLAKSAPPDAQAKVHFDAESSGDVKIHKLDVQSDFDEKARAILGSNSVYVAFRSDAVFVSGGADGLKAIQEAVKGESKPAPAGMFEISMTHLAPLIMMAHAKDHGDGKPDAEQMKKLVEETFKEGKDKIRITVEGGSAAKGTFEMDAEVIKFAALMEKHNEGGLKKPAAIKKPSKKSKEPKKEKEKDKEEDK